MVDGHGYRLTVMPNFSAQYWSSYFSLVLILLESCGRFPLLDRQP